jgi:sulfite reductase (NADPH) hemoprotein beta-component
MADTLILEVADFETDVLTGIYSEETGRPQPLRITIQARLKVAERYLPEFLTRVEERLAAHGLARQELVLRITGCPNGCARPFLAEIALVGKAPGRYNLYLGGDERGQRLNALYRENIDEAAILAALDELFAHFSRERLEGERLGAFARRKGYVGASA